MFLSICLDRQDGESQSDFRTRAEEIESHGPDLVLLAREEEDGRLAPPRTEALVDMAWLTGVLRWPAVVAGLPALHSVPFHVARALSAVDFLSGGRAGWMPMLGNAVAFDRAYGAEHAGGSAATARADDFVRATRALLDSWDDDALLLDKEAGRYLDSAKVRRVDYRGSAFSVMGPLNAARPPQGYPLLVRDLDDLPHSREPADILIGSILPAAAPGTIRLLKVTADAEAAEGAGDADGLHLAGPSALDMLRGLRRTAEAPAPRSHNARTAFGLAHPANPYSERNVA